MTNGRNKKTPPAARNPKKVAPASSAGGKALIDAMKSSPHRDVQLDPERYPLPVRKTHINADLSSRWFFARILCQS